MWEDPVISLTSLTGMRESSLRSSLWVVRVLGRMMCNNHCPRSGYHSEMELMLFAPLFLVSSMGH